MPTGPILPEQALAMAEEMQQFDVKWFEEPVTSDDPGGHAPGQRTNRFP